MAQLLIAYGADLEIKGDKDDTPLTVALIHRQFEFAKFILDRGANPNAVDRKGFTLVDRMRRRNRRAVALLTEHGALDAKTIRMRPT